MTSNRAGVQLTNLHKEGEMGTNEQKIAVLFDEMTTAAANLAAAQQRTNTAAQDTDTWVAARRVELVTEARYALAVERWIQAQL